MKPQMRNATSTSHKTQATTNAYSASVPISVYRELAAELQEAQAMLGSLYTKNHQLAQQNQQLRQEVEKVVHSALYAQQVIASFQSVGTNEVPYARSENRTEVRTPPRPAATVRRHRPPAAAPVVEVAPPYQKAETVAPDLSEKLYTEQEQGRNRRPPQPEKTSDVSGWWLLGVICVILLTSFGTGLWIVRPLLNGR